MSVATTKKTNWESINSYFIGRQQELDLLSEYSRERGTCIAVTGHAGVGKTSLLRAFERKEATYFSGGVYHVSGKDKLSGIRRHLVGIENTTDHVLVVIDDVELLNTSEVTAIYNVVVSQLRSTLILSGRLVPVSEISTIRVINLDELDTSEILQSRLMLIQDKTDIEKALEVIERHARLLQSLVSTYQDNIYKLHSRDYSASIREITDIPNVTTNVEIDNVQVNIQRKKDTRLDVFSIIITVILFMTSLVLSTETERSILARVGRAEKTITEQVLTGGRGRLNQHHAITWLNLRKHPRVENDNIVAVVKPSQLFFVLRISNGWAEIFYTDNISSKEYSGWVYSKYIEFANGA